MEIDKLKVVVADDERLFLQGICAWIRAQEDEFELVGAATNGEEALSLVREHHPDILLTDIRMPRMDGIALIKKIEEEGPPLVAIIISAYDDREYVQYAIRSPVVYDYINKPFSKEEFSDLLHSAADSRRRQMGTDQQGSREEWMLTQAILQGKKEQVKAAFRTLWSSQDNSDVEACIRFAGELFLKIGLRVQPKKMAPHTSVFWVYNEIQKIERCQTGEEVERYLEDYISHLNENPDKQERGRSLFIISCLDIINRRLEDSDLSVSTVAREMDVTDNYLSGRFSRDMDVSFTRYVTMARIERAKEYLRDTHMKIYEISEKLGFNDSRYFVKVFKEYVGMRPSDYRERIMEK